MPHTGQPVSEKLPKPGKSDALKKKAQKAINAFAPPLSISNLFGGFRPDVRGDLEIELDLEIPERFAMSQAQALQSNTETNFAFDGEPDGVTAGLKHIASGASLGIAQKLLQSAPTSQEALLAEFMVLRDLTVMVPTSYLEVLALLGKTDYLESKIRVEDNPYIVKYHYLKAIWYATQLRSWHASPGADVPYEAGLTRLMNLRVSDLQNVVFNDVTSVSRIKKRGREVLDREFKTSQQITLDDVNYRVSPPFLSENPTIRDFINWVQNLPPVFNQEFLATIGVITIFTRRWLDRLDDRLGQIDDRFDNTVLATVTPHQVLNAVDLFYIGDYFPGRDDFRDTVTNVITWYNSEAFNLNRLIMLTDSARSSFGSPAQLVYLTDENKKRQTNHFFLDANDNPIPAMVPLENATGILSKRKLTTPGSILTAAAFIVTRGVKVKEQFRGFSNVPLQEIAARVARRSYRTKGNP